MPPVAHTPLVHGYYWNNNTQQVFDRRGRIVTYLDRYVGPGKNHQWIDLPIRVRLWRVEWTLPKLKSVVISRGGVWID